MNEDYTYDRDGNHVKREHGFNWGVYAPVRPMDSDAYRATESRRQRREAESFQRVMDRVLVVGLSIILLLLLLERLLN